MVINAYAAFKAKGELKKFSYEPQPLKPFDVRIKVTHCGICHSDVHLIDNDWSISEYPLVPGHEVVGAVAEMGKDVAHLNKGDRVGIGWRSGSCMECEWCMKGDDNLCSQGEATCVGHHGGFAEYTQVDSRFTFPIPEGIESENAAPLLCGGITVFSPLRRLGVLPTMKVGVIGIGGLGHLAVQFASAFGCEVTAFSSTPAKEKEAKILGAHNFIATKSDGPLKKIQGTLDFILSTVNVDLNWQEYIHCLRPNGKLCFVGVPPRELNIPIFTLIDKQKSIVGSVIGGRVLIKEMLEFAARHKIKAQTEVVPLSQVNSALQKVRENKARYRMVLKCT